MPQVLDSAEAVTTEEDPLSLPPHGSEVFMGGLNRSATDWQIREFASEVGEVYSIKMIRDQTNPDHNKGYCFVTYTDKESALKAMDKLAGKELANFPGQRVRVAPSQAKNKLYVGNIPHSMDAEGLRNAIEGPYELKGLQAVDVARNRDNPDENRGFAFLEFYNAACATHAKTKLSAPDVRIGDRTINVDLAEPSGREQSTAIGTRSIYVGNLPSGIDEETLKELFSKYGEIESVFFPRPKEGEDHPKFAFVQFVERVAAARAVDAEEKPAVADVQLTVKFGRAEGSQHHGHGGRGDGQHRYRPVGGRGGYGGQHAQQQESYYGGNDGYGGGYMMGMGGMMGMMPVQLPNGQMGYMLQPTALMGGGGGMDGGPLRGRGGYGGGRGYGYGGGGRYGGRGGGYGGGRGGRGGYQRYQPY